MVSETCQIKFIGGANLGLFALDTKRAEPSLESNYPKEMLSLIMTCQQQQIQQSFLGIFFKKEM